MFYCLRDNYNILGTSNPGKILLVYFPSDNQLTNRKLSVSVQKNRTFNAYNIATLVVSVSWRRGMYYKI